MRNSRMTVADLRAAKGQRVLTMLYVETLDEAAAASAAGVDVLSIIAPVWTPLCVRRRVTALCRLVFCMAN